ncbi:MAG: threonine synthase [Acidobacteria bacterium RIFCSPLOWO2_02_FULL_68_18]|nr:MAG: threonine synthase [Acidobacteria bacterium RIFCSPLOWO2_02_FULL_68_18]OFW48041.1 MAG: threonine synthase [Acidobacteria bacterium RIFCSPLOWO2_12_FULL_68_19]
MKWVSTRRASPPVPFIDALFAGTAPDGGLYLPERFEPLPAPTLERLRSADLVTIGTVVGTHLLAGDISELQMGALVRDALDFPIPLVQVTERVWALELFHGPTLAFKDVGARTQARLLHHFTDGTPLTILVATSGDTGSAVAQAFYQVPDSRVFVLYPEGQVSDVQEAQMASLGGNVTAVAVAGTFDDCQRLVKQAFADGEVRKKVWLTPANSINLGRLLPQAFYYFLVARLRQPPVVAVPSGNFGNLTAGLIATRLGLRVRRLVAATNVNDVVPEYLRTGIYEPRPSVRTVANAMDVGAPSNFERMRAMYDDDLERMRGDVAGAAFEDTRVVAEIGRVYKEFGYLLDPHGAIAWLGLQQVLATDPKALGVFLATAHPAKFREVVEPAIGEAVPLPSTLADALARPRHSERLAVSPAALVDLILR